jgi:hypothetical protein
MQGIMLRNAVAIGAAAVAVVAAAGLARSASADVWVLTDQRLEKLLAGGRRAFSLPYAGRLARDQLEVDSRDGSVWFYDREPPAPPPDGVAWFDVWRLVHVARDGTRLSETRVLDGFGLAVDRGRGGVWISRPEGRTNPRKLAPFNTPAELLLLDFETGAITARVHGFRPRILEIMLGADGALWVQHWGGSDASWTRLAGTLAELDGYDVSSGDSGPHHRRVDVGSDVDSASAVNLSDGSVWLSRMSRSGAAPEVVKLSPEGLLLGTFVPRAFDDELPIAGEARHGSSWLADSL